MLKLGVRGLAISLLVQALAVQAQILTYELTYSSSGSDTLTGTFSIDTSDPGASDFYEVESLPAWFQSLDFSYDSGGTITTYDINDFSEFYWDPPASPDWNSDLVPQFEDINFFGSELEGLETFVLEHIPSGTEFTLTSASPIPEPSEYAWAAAGCLFTLAAVRTYRKNRGAATPLKAA